MKLSERCYGCGKRIWPWSKVIQTTNGYVHYNKSCLFDAWHKFLVEDGINSKALYRLFTETLNKK